MKTNYKRVSTAIALQIMMKVYSPIIKFYKEMVKNECYDYSSKCKKYVVRGLNELRDNKIDMFLNDDYTFTLDKVSEDIVAIHNKYIDVCGNSLFVALSKVFECLLKDINKIWSC